MENREETICCNCYPCAIRFVIEGANAFDFVVVGRRGNIGDYTHHPASNVFIASNNETCDVTSFRNPPNLR